MTAPSVTAPVPAPSRPGNRVPLTPGRTVALMLGVPVALVVIAATSFGLAGNLAQGSYPLHKAVAITGHRVSLDVNGGNLDVSAARAASAPAAGSSGAAVLDGTVRYSFVRPSLQVLTVGGGTSVGVTGCQPVDLGNCSFDAKLAVPAATSAALSSGGGDLSVSGLTGVISASTAGGNVTATHLPGPVTLSTGGGDVTMTGLSGTTSVRTAGGNINGSAIASGMVTATTGGGDVSLVFARAPGKVTVTAAGGNVTIVVPHGLYRVNAHTAGGNMNGNLINGNDDTSPNVITVSTGGGDINVSEAP